MRIRKIEFENINSYVGKVTIDFTDPQYKKNNNQFVISGETGNGKSTILDAISLALYGRTDRLGKITDQNLEEILNRQSGTCMAAVEYECAKGLFRSEFEGGRAYKKRSGNPQKPKYRIYSINHDASRDLLRSSDTSVDRLGNDTEGLTGLSYDQFSRCILIPQGQFDAFLTSSEKEKGNILAKLSNTEHYKKMGTYLWTKCNDKEKDLDTQIKLRDGTFVLSPEEVKEKEERLGELDTEIETLKNKIEAVQAYIDANNRLTQAVQRFESAKKEMLKQEALAGEMEGKKKELEGARKAQACGGEYGVFNSTEKDLAESLQKNRALLENEGKDRKALAAELEQYLSDHRADAELAPVRGQINAEKKNLENLNKTVSELRKGKAELEKQLESGRQNQVVLEARQAALQAEMASYAGQNSQSLARYIRGTLKSGDICPVCGNNFAGADHKHVAQEGREEADKAQPVIAAFLSLEEESDSLQKEISDTQTEVVRIKAGIGAKDEAMEEKEAEKQKHLSEIGSLIAPWGLSLEAGEENAAIDKALGTLRALGEAYGEKKNILEILRAIEQQEQRRDEARQKLEEAMRKNGFLSLDAFLDSRREDKDINRLETDLRAFEKTIQTAEANYRMAEQEYAACQELEQSGKTMEALQEEKKQLENSRDQCSQEIGGIREALKNNEDNKKRREEYEHTIAEIKRELPVLREIKSMIGTKEGDKFQTFVQTIIFGNFLDRADEYFHTMLPEYRMKQHEDMEDGKAVKKLDIDIMQVNNDGTDIRGIKNLSGGEKFIASLALALGIAEFAGQNSAVESIFLDEGFGSLSGEPLQQAIACLKRLGGTGKTLGIITHVEPVIEAFNSLELKAEKRNGRSTLRGPGVTQI